MEYESTPRNPSLTIKSRRSMADRLNWPAGALEICEEIESDFPDWYPTYVRPNMQRSTSRPGFYAIRHIAWRAELPAYGSTGDRLKRALEAWRSTAEVSESDAAQTLDGNTTFVGLAEITERTRIASPVIGLLIRKGGFPPPIADLASGPIWSAIDVENWIASPDSSRSDSLMSAGEIRSRLNVSRQRVYQLTCRPDWPRPCGVFGNGKVWRRSDVEEWIAEHR